jgi:integrase
MKSSGLCEATLRGVSFSLKYLAKNVDLSEPENVKLFISNMPQKNSYKRNVTNAYNYVVILNGMNWQKPRYKVEHKIPLIPTTANVNKIISASTKKYATIFTILAETGLEAHELATVTRDDIDIENGILNAQGCKGHAPRSFKLKQATKGMLSEYLHNYKGEKPFPASCHMSHIWTRTRNKLADMLQKPELKRVKMRNLRNYSGAQLYHRTKDPIRVMRHLGHKKLETTMHYLRGIHLDAEEEYTCRTATNAKEATELMEVGFEYVATTPQDLMLFRKRK